VVAPKQDGPLLKPKKDENRNWAEKVEKAKEARDAGKKARAGKSPVFRTR
jgi:hypothetical protein